MKKRTILGVVGYGLGTLIYGIIRKDLIVLRIGVNFVGLAIVIYLWEYVMGE